MPPIIKEMPRKLARNVTYTRIGNMNAVGINFGISTNAVIVDWETTWKMNVKRLFQVKVHIGI